MSGKLVGKRSGERVARNAKQAEPTWSGVKTKLANVDRAGLVGLIKDLHGLSRDNQAFLNARLGLGPDPLSPYKKTITRWISPDVVRGQDISVAKGKKAISDYKKAIGLPEGIAELSVHYCEAARDLFAYCGVDDSGYCSALVGVFAQALSVATTLPEPDRERLLCRLDDVRSDMINVGWGVWEEMSELWDAHAALD